MPTVTSDVYTVSPVVYGSGTISNVPYGTGKIVFEGGFTPGPEAAGVHFEGVSDPVVTGDILEVNSVDGTVTTYNIVVNPVITPLVTPVLADLSEYTAALNAVHQADYTLESWTAYQTIVTANPVSPVNTQAQVDAATAAIKDAQNALVLNSRS